MTNGRGKSDGSTVPTNSRNKAEGPAAEAREGRELAKGNSPECNALRTQGRESTPSAITFLYYCGVRLGEATQIEWSQVDLVARLIVLEDEQTKNAEARTVPLPSVLVMMLAEIEPRVGKVFSDTNLRTEWQKACAACGLGTRTLVKPEDEDSYQWYKYEGLIVHDLRRSAVRNLVNAGVPERVAMKIGGHKTRAVFDRYHIVSTEDVTNAMRRVELNGVDGESLVKVSLSLPQPQRLKR